MADELISINVWLSGRSYRIRIKQQEEEAVRKAVKIADEKIMEMRRHYAGKDDQDFIAMCLLMYAADSVVESPINPLMQQEIISMTERIDSVLQKKS